MILWTAAMLLSTPAAAWKPWPLPMDSADTSSDTLTYNVSATGTGASGACAPFWFSAARDGTVPTQPGSILLRGRIQKPAVRDARWWDYSYGVDVTGGAGFTPRPVSVAWYGRITELYAHTRLWCFDITAGWKPMDTGNQDRYLSAGGLLVSRNAPPFPRITVGIDKWTAFPFLYGYLEVKGAVTHGWFTDGTGVKNTLLHHKFAGIRIGGKLPVNISYEFHHAAQWGGVSDKYGALGSSLKNWWTIFRAKSGGVTASDKINAEGNHIGSQMLGLDINIKGWKIKAYWQNIFEDGPVNVIWNSMNIYDGLWGLSIRQIRWRFIESMAYEVVCTTDQSGPAHDIDGIIFGGNDDYFRNSLYYQGWNHYRMTIGTPFITSPAYNADGSLMTHNNRTVTHHVAARGDIYGFGYLIRYSHSRNYGRYNEYRSTTNNSMLIEVHKNVPQAWNLDFGFAFGADSGTQFGNTYGVMLTVARSGIIWTSKQ